VHPGAEGGGSDAPPHLLKNLLTPVYFFLCFWNALLTSSLMGKLAHFAVSFILVFSFFFLS